MGVRKHLYTLRLGGEFRDAASPKHSCAHGVVDDNVKIAPAFIIISDRCYRAIFVLKRKVLFFQRLHVT